MMSEAHHTIKRDKLSYRGTPPSSTHCEKWRDARKASLRSICPDQAPWSMRVNCSWDALARTSAIAEEVVMLVQYRKALR